MNIVAIGGGEIRQRETLKLDRFIRDLAGKQTPNLLFIPTAGDDAEGYCHIVGEVYGKDLDCRVDDLRLISDRLSNDQIQDKILSADIIYVGGGNTQRMMEVWRNHGVDKLLEQVASDGTILSGISAGAICWHDFGHSDSESFAGRSDWDYTRVDGLGICPGLFCPHLDGEQRPESFSQMVQYYNLVGIGCENNAAVWYQQGKSPVVKTSQPNAKVHILRMNSGEVSTKYYSENEEIAALKTVKRTS